VAVRSAALAIAAAAVLLVLTQVPLVPASSTAQDGARFVPVDTWLAAQFPAARDVYRQRLAVLFQPRRLPVLALFVALLAASVVSYPRALGAWLAARVPPVSATALGAFRLVFGAAMLLALLRETPPDVIPYEAQRASSWLARQDLIRQLAATPDASATIRHVASVALALFAIGAWPRVTLMVAAAALTLFVGIGLNQKAMHDWGVPLITLWALASVPWHDSVGVQTAVARWRGRPIAPATPAARGLALWLPALTLGVAFAAAAFAKLDTSGLAWITGGAVRFHFLQDAHQAPVEWGLRVAGSDVAAIGLSLAAVVTEGLFWMVALTPSLALRAAFGLAGLAMMIGFYLFQGVLWPAWWALFLVFLPWPLVDRIGRARTGVDRRAPAGLAMAATIPAVASAVIVAIVAQQPIVSALRVESEPFLSDYSMYAYTWPSKRAFNEQFGEKVAYELSAEGRSSDGFREWLRATPVFLDAMNDAAGRSIRGEAWPEATRSAVTATRRAYQIEFGEPLSIVVVRQLVRGFDWDRGAFDVSPRPTAEGTLDLDAERFASR
jgi:hypothetical protein